MHHFAHDINLLNFNKSVKFVRKQVNHDLKNLADCLKAKNISLNVVKTELVLFTSPKKQRGCDLKIKLNGKGCIKKILSNIWKFKLTKTTN